MSESVTENHTSSISIDNIVDKLMQDLNMEPSVFVRGLVIVCLDIFVAGLEDGKNLNTVLKRNQMPRLVEGYHTNQFNSTSDILIHLARNQHINPVIESFLDLVKLFTPIFSNWDEESLKAGVFSEQVKRLANPDANLIQKALAHVYQLGVDYSGSQIHIPFGTLLNHKEIH